MLLIRPLGNTDMLTTVTLNVVILKIAAPILHFVSVGGKKPKYLLFVE